MFRFLSKVDVIELGGSDELCGKGYELALFLFSDVLEISKKKSGNKGLGLRSPSTMSLRNVGAGNPGTLSGHNNNPGLMAKDAGTKYFKHVNLFNLTSIKRVVDVVETETDACIFALVCRTNQVRHATTSFFSVHLKTYAELLQVLKERMFVFQLASDEVDKMTFLRQLCRSFATNMCRTDSDTYLKQMKAEDLGLEPADFNLSNFSSTYRTLQKKVTAFPSTCPLSHS